MLNTTKHLCLAQAIADHYQPAQERASRVDTFAYFDMPTSPQGIVAATWAYPPSICRPPLSACPSALPNGPDSL